MGDEGNWADELDAAAVIEMGTRRTDYKVGTRAGYTIRLIGTNLFWLTTTSKMSACVSQKYTIVREIFMKYGTYVLVVLALLLSACSDNTPFEPSSAKSQLEIAKSAPQTVTKPFWGHWTTTFEEPGAGVLGCDENEETGVFTIFTIGNATHLGANTGVQQSESDFITQCGHSELVAANGDVLEFAFAGTVDDSGFPAVLFSGDFWFTGGTGRFEGATGSGVYEGTANVFEAAGEVTNIGSLTLPLRTGSPSGNRSTM